MIRNSSVRAGSGASIMTLYAEKTSPPENRLLNVLV